jgi:hypothetical protein
VPGTSEIESRYANHLEVGQNAVEVILQFGQLFDEAETAVVHTRIVTSPFYARRFLELLQESIGRHQTDVPQIQDENR